MQPAATAAAGQHQPGAHAGDNAAQQAAGEHVVHNGRGGDGDQAQEESIGGGNNQRVAGEDLAQGAVGQEQQGDIQGVVDQSRDIEAEGVQPQDHQDRGPQQLAEAHHSAGNQAQGHHEEVDAHGVDQRAQRGHG